MKWTIALAVFACASSASAQKLGVTIIDRQDKEDEYDYAAVYNNVAVGKTFKVHGATFTLQLPDGRLAVVNCDSKFAEHMAGPVGNRRSCRTPDICPLSYMRCCPWEALFAAFRWPALRTTRRPEVFGGCGD